MATRLKPAEVVAWYTADQAAKYTDVSPAMVNYLCRAGLVVPTASSPRKRQGRGALRCYSFGDLVALRLVAKLCTAGVSPLRLKRGLLSLRQYHPEITMNHLPASHVATDGKDIYLRNGKDALERLVDGQLSFAFVVELKQIQKEVLRKLRKTA